ncbi:MAG: hypothetical protein GY756_23645 [bacterium]|nr:hypothetical protein [bacterium]
MSLPDNVKKIIDKALLHLEKDPNNDLNLGYRRAIWKEFGSKLNLIKSTDKTGLQRRTILALLTSKKVLSFWERVWPEDKTPLLIINEVEDILNAKKNYSEREKNKRMRDLWCWLEDFRYDDEDEQQLAAVIVGDAAIATINAALFDERFDENSIDFEVTDEDVDPYTSDSSYSAAMVYAHGSIWNDFSNKQKRKEFWEWWLKEAVPKAWNMDY